MVLNSSTENFVADCLELASGLLNPLAAGQSGDCSSIDYAFVGFPESLQQLIMLSSRLLAIPPL